MSISVDDLVASLSCSHIGQEATDLAILQTQLAQAFFGQSIASSGGRVRRGSRTTHPCNTPTARTPSSSFSFGHLTEAQQQALRRSIEDRSYDGSDEMMQDEQMVEDLLIPISPASPTVAAQPSFSYHPTHAHSHSHSSSPTSPNGAQFNTYVNFSHQSPGLQPSDTSLFTSTDPFYLAQLQASQKYNSPHHSFTRAGLPSQHSPFMFQQQPTY